MPDMTGQLDVSEIIETFDVEEARKLISTQLESLSDDACEFFTDNFKMFYQHYASLKNKRDEVGVDLFEEAEVRFLQICRIFMDEIAKKYGFQLDQDYLAEHEKDIPSLTLPLYLFLVLDVRSNLFNVVISFISKNHDAIWETFKDSLSKHDSVTVVNRNNMEDPFVALVASNTYSIVDWVMDQLNMEIFLENSEPGYAAYGPFRQMIDDGIIEGEDVIIDTFRDMIHNNIALKARICFDIVCKIKGFNLT